MVPHYTWNDWIAVFKVKVTAKVQTVIYVSLDNTLWFQMVEPLTNLILWCIVVSWSVMQKDCCFQGWGHNEGSYNQSMAILAIFCELLIPLQSNPDGRYIIISQCLLWLVNRLDCCFQGWGHNEGSYNQSMAILAIFCELLIPLQSNPDGRYIIISQCLLWLVNRLDCCVQG